MPSRSKKTEHPSGITEGRSRGISRSRSLVQMAVNGSLRSERREIINQDQQPRSTSSAEIPNRKRPLILRLPRIPATEDHTRVQRSSGSGETDGIQTLDHPTHMTTNQSPENVGFIEPQLPESYQQPADSSARLILRLPPRRQYSDSATAAPDNLQATMREQFNAVEPMLRLLERRQQLRQNQVNRQRFRMNESSPLLAPELAVSKDIVDSFGSNGLVGGVEEDITGTEEMTFQKVLRRKMICDVCTIHMKQFRCSKCLYSMCLNCKNTISSQTFLLVTCPHCREKQKEFEQIKLPRY